MTVAADAEGGADGARGARADEVGLDPTLSPTPSSVVTGWRAFRRDLEEAGGVALGRLVGFERLTELVG